MERAEVAPAAVNWVGMDRSELDITQEHAVERALDAIRPDAIINCAAYTAVDRAEQELSLAFAVNAEGPGILARAAAQRGIDLLHVSTDYVFDGSKKEPYLPSDATRPLGVYGASKLAGELAVLAAGGKSWVVRVAWLYDAWGPNFLHTMLRHADEGRTLSVVDDQFGTPTSAVAFAGSLQHWAREPERWSPGIWHYGHRGITTWYAFAREIFLQSHMEVDLNPSSTADYPTPARRPAYSHLDPEAWFKAAGQEPVTWEAALAECLSIMRNERR